MMLDKGLETDLYPTTNQRYAWGRLPRLVGRVLLLGGGLLGLVGCQSHAAAPVDPSGVLDRLDRVMVDTSAPARSDGRSAPGGGAFDPSDGISMREAAAIGVRLDPGLQQLRAERGVARCQLTEAGLLPDVELGWDAADWLVGGTSDDVLSGFGISWEAPRPGEIAAKRGIAKARVEEVRYSIMDAEWRRAREISIAWLDVLGARRRLKLNQRLLEIAGETHEYLSRGRAAKTATALDENLAGIEFSTIEAERLRLTVAEEEAWQELNFRMGLPPSSRFVIQTDGDPFAYTPGIPSAAALVHDAVARRPDLKELLAVYEQAEQALRLEVKRQWPRMVLGSGFALDLAIGSRFNHPAIRTKLAVRNRVRLKVTAAVHQLRREVHAAVADLLRTSRQLEFYETKLDPRLRESLRLSAEARVVTEITPLQLLTSQRQVLETRTRYLEIRVQHRKNRQLVETVSGRWLSAAVPATTEIEEKNE